MSYSYENFAVDKTKINYSQKCFYLINLIKAKDEGIWEALKPQYDLLKPEESWDFYQLLVEEYRKLLPVENKSAPKKKVVAKPAKKAAPKKKATKKPAKKK